MSVVITKLAVKYKSEEFEALLHLVSQRCITFSRDYLLNELFESVQYFVIPNASYDGNQLVGDEEVFLEDSLPDHQYHQFTAKEAVRFLWRDGKVPEWIDLSVVGASKETTFIELRCCGRFSCDPSKYYYDHRGTGPFGIKSPTLPVAWDEKNPVKFALPAYKPLT
ncbi:MAG: hypothetical protein AAGC44_05010 [Planctomycetota bacterium]